MSNLPQAEKKVSNELDETNFRAFAQDIIRKYSDSGMVLDALIWGRIIALYEKALEEKAK